MYKKRALFTGVGSNEVTVKSVEDLAYEAACNRWSDKSKEFI